MGRWFTRFFEGQGLEVLVADIGSPRTSQEVAAEADVVIISVPSWVTGVAEKYLIPGSRFRCRLVDLTSVKQRPMAVMMSARPRVVRRHPLRPRGSQHRAGHGLYRRGGGELVSLAPDFCGPAPG